MQKFSWMVTIICCSLGALTAFFGVVFANGAPQQAAAAAVGVAWAVIPYCFSRAIEKLNPKKIAIDDESLQKMIVANSSTKSGLYV